MNGRNLLIKRMQQLQNQGYSCVGCQGTCCTFEANSMMVTPLEAFELLHYLKTHHEHTNELKHKLLETITKYRLDHQFGNGKRSYLRRTYTCPFFNHQELGCPLPLEVKPYGCLAFNAHHAEEKASSHCFSEIKLLEEREKSQTREQNKNAWLKDRYKLIWEKSPLPTALLDIWDVEINNEDLALN